MPRLAPNPGAGVGNGKSVSLGCQLFDSFVQHLLDFFA